MYPRNNVADLWVRYITHTMWRFGVGQWDITLRKFSKHFLSRAIGLNASRGWICHSYRVISEAYISPRWYTSGNIYWVTSDLYFPIFKTSRVARNRWRIIITISSISIWRENRRRYLSLGGISDLFLKGHSFPRATRSEQCSLLRTDNVRGQLVGAYFPAKWRLSFIYPAVTI